jgi:hypothetical protein
MFGGLLGFLSGLGVAVAVYELPPHPLTSVTEIHKFPRDDQSTIEVKIFGRLAYTRTVDDPEYPEWEPFLWGFGPTVILLLLGVYIGMLMGHWLTGRWTARPTEAADYEELTRAPAVASERRPPASSRDS